MSGIRVTYSGLISLVTGIIKLGVGLIFILVVTRTLTTVEFGTWQLIFGLLAYSIILAPVASFWITRNVARGIPSGKTGIFFGELIALGGIMIYLIGSFFYGTNSELNFSLLLIGIILVPVRYLTLLIQAVDAGWKPQLVSYAELLAEIIKVPMVILFVYYLKMGIEGVILTFFIAYCVSCTIQIIFAREKIREKIQLSLIKKWIKLSWIPLYPSLSSFLFRSDVLLFPILTNSVEGLAFYGAALAIGNIVSISARISTAVYGKLLESTNRNFISNNLTMLFSVAIPLSALSITFSRSALFALNPIYEVATIVVVFLTFRNLLWNLNVIFSNFLSGTENVDTKEKSTFREYIKSKLFFVPSVRLLQYCIYIISLIVLLLIFKGSNILDLVTIWAITAFIIEIPFTFYYYYLVKKSIPISINLKSISKYLFSSIISFGFMYVLMEQFLEFNEQIFVFLPNLLIYIGMGLGMYLSIICLIDSPTKNLIKQIIKEMRIKF